MPIRKITNKKDRKKVVHWIRSGAPVKLGASLYAMLAPDSVLVEKLKPNPSNYQEQMRNDFCVMMGITRNKFNLIIKEYSDGQIKPITKRDGETKDRPVKSRIAPQKIERSRSFRNEWPFLSRPECPTQLKALAADKISCWERYTEAHKKLFDCSTVKECHQVAHDLIENFKENRLIFEELDHYKKYGDKLGKHPVWDQYNRFEALNGLNVIELVKLHENVLPHRIWRIESEIKKGDKPHLLGERNKRLNQVKAELAEVKRLLRI